MITNAFILKVTMDRPMIIYEPTMYQSDTSVYLWSDYVIELYIFGISSLFRSKQTGSDQYFKRKYQRWNILRHIDGVWFKYQPSF